MAETIWEGDVKEFSRAFDLICIVDQIQDYAVNQHRPFVMNHLEAWHARHQKTLDPFKKAFCEINTAAANMDMSNEDSDTSGFDSDEISNESYDFDKDSEIGGFDSDGRCSSSYDYDMLEELLLACHNKPAEWLRLKEQSKNARQEIANETRQRNRSLLKPHQAPESAKEPQETRPRGRPRKPGVAKKQAPNGGIGELLERARPRGRPRKAGVAKKEAPKRGRGRPPKMANKIITAGQMQSKPLL